MNTQTAETIREAREAKGWSQAELAHRAHLGGPSVVSNAERGLAGESVRRRIARALGVSVEELSA
jgi:transcriptional regulator with XRE-family HTH domain